MFEFLGTHGHLLHTWHVPKYSLHSYNSPQTLFPIASLYADVVFKNMIFYYSLPSEKWVGKKHTHLLTYQNIQLILEKMADIIIAFIFDNLSQVIKKLL